MGFLPVELRGKTAVVTGATGGIGRRMAEALAERGAGVGVLDLNAGKAQALAGDIKADGGRAIGCGVDVTDAARLSAALDEVRGAFGPIDILVTAAGILIPGSFADLTDADWRKLHDVNVMGTVSAVRLVVPDMISKGGGRIVTVSSALSAFAIVQRSAYAATKAAVSSLTQSLAVELGGHGITVNALAPTAVITDINRKLIATQPELYRPLIEGTPMRRLGTVDDVANQMLYLVSDQASFITGSTHPVDGGFMIC